VLTEEGFRRRVSRSRAKPPIQVLTVTLKPGKPRGARALRFAQNQPPRGLSSVYARKSEIPRVLRAASASRAYSTTARDWMTGRAAPAPPDWAAKVVAFVLVGVSECRALASFRSPSPMGLRSPSRKGNRLSVHRLARNLQRTFAPSMLINVETGVINRQPPVGRAHPSLPARPDPDAGREHWCRA